MDLAPAPSEHAPLFRRGLVLFNERDFFEAHETWEDLWHMAEGERKRFYQGLIQCAVTLVHVQRGNPRGVQTVWKTAQSKFHGLPAVYMGLEIQDLLTRLATFLTPVLKIPRDVHPPGQGHGQHLPVNLLQAPQIQLQYDPFDADLR